MPQSNLFDNFSRTLAQTTSRREVLRLLSVTLAGGLLASLGVGCGRQTPGPGQPEPTECPSGTTTCGEVCCPSGESCVDGTCQPDVTDACLIASVCGGRQYCNEEQTCICIETTEGDKRCGQIPSTCDVDFCESSADCAHLGEGYFCDTPTSGCCNPQASRCIAPCGTPANGVISGRHDTVRYAVEATSETTAQARFTLEGSTDQLLVTISGRDQGEIVWKGVTIDGYGALTNEEDAALTQLYGSAFAEALAMAPLNLACQREDVPPAALAALLLPWQLLLKYQTPELEEAIRSAADQATCLYFATPTEVYESDRPLRAYPLLSNEDPFPNVFGFFPFDAEGAIQAQQLTLTPLVQQDKYGPGGATCRGACGPDCEPDNCGSPSEEWRCIEENGQNTGYKELWLIYTCGTHAGCREHDDCYDICKGTHGSSGWDSIMCHRECDYAAVDKYGFSNTNSWRTGGGPFDSTETYEYRITSPALDQQMCPTQVYCNCNQTCYTSASACLDECKASLGCFTGICGPAEPGQCS